MLAAGAIGSGMEINCDIAEAFDISQAKTGRPFDAPVGAIAASQLQIALSRRLDPSGSRQWNMGQSSAPRKQAKLCKSIPATDPIPDPDDLPAG